jgi:hypothetical protein
VENGGDVVVGDQNAGVDAGTCARKSDLDDDPFSVASEAGVFYKHHPHPTPLRRNDSDNKEESDEEDSGEKTQRGGDSGTV